jgi:hypothetical protein
MKNDDNPNSRMTVRRVHGQKVYHVDTGGSTAGPRILFLILRAMEISQRHKAKPGIIFPTPNAAVLSARALSLAKAGREDREAVQELQRLSRNRRKDLRSTAAGLRAEGWTDESELYDRATRLVRAAIEDSGVTPVKPDQKMFFAAVRRLEELPLDRAFAELQVECPSLVEVEQKVEDAHPRYASGAKKRLKQSAAQELVLGEFGEPIAKLVGPLARKNSNRLLKSKTAYWVAVHYLVGLLMDQYRSQDGI